MPKNIKLFISFCILITITICLGILQVIVKHSLKRSSNLKRSTKQYQVLQPKKKSFNNFSKYKKKKRYHLINTEYINFPKEKKESERRSNTLPFNLSKKKYIAPYIVTTNLTYVCNIFATEKHPLPGNYSNLLHLEIKMPKRCDNIILPPASSWLLFQLWEEDISKNTVRQQRSLEQFHTLSINHIKK